MKFLRKNRSHQNTKFVFITHNEELDEFFEARNRENLLKNLKDELGEDVLIEEVFDQEGNQLNPEAALPDEILNDAVKVFGKRAEETGQFGFV